MFGELAALGTALCWSVSAVLYKRALEETKPVAANTVRCAATSLLLVLSITLAGKIGVLATLPSQVVFLACASGVIGLGLGDTLYMFSIRTLGVSRAVPITCTYPLFSLVWASILAGEAITIQAFLGALLIVIGIWLLSGEKSNDTAEKRSKKLWIRGLASAISTAVAWSISISMINLAVKRIASFEQAYAINTIRMVAVTASLTAFASAGNRSFAFLKMKRKNVVILATAGLIALGLGWFLLALSLTYIPESQAVPISSTTPLFSTLASIVFLHEKVAARVSIGSVMVVLGILVVFI